MKFKVYIPTSWFLGYQHYWHLGRRITTICIIPPFALEFTYTP